MPLVNPVVDRMIAKFQFQPFEGYTSFSSQLSNDVSVFILDEDTNIIKTVDKPFALSGEELTYSSFIANTGNLKSINMIFKDIIPTGTSFVENSVFLDGVNLPGVNPENGINVGEVDVG